MVGAGCFAARARKYKKNPFFKDKFSSKETVFLLSADHGKKKWGREKKRKRVATDANYIPRIENSEKRYKGEDVTTLVLNKEGLPGTSAKTVWAKRSGGTLERLNVSERSYVSTFPSFIYMSLLRK